jgi:hypothetical protein
MITREQFDRIDNCQEYLNYVASQPSLAIAWDNCERPDWLLSFAMKARIASKEQFVRVAIGEAEAVLHTWTARYPDDDQPQKAIQAAKDCLGDQTSETRAAAHAAASAASAAAYHADDKDALVPYVPAAAYAAAYASAYASYVTNADANAAAHASDDKDALSPFVAVAAYVAANADDKDAFRRAQCDRIRAIIPNPFIDHEGNKQ